uniref:Zinc ribbon domain-containing protein n=1 Tax=Geobacter metallireducens TaxID=28232 RepID=A0A831UEK4_GEOME
MAEFVKPAYLAFLLVIVVPGVAGGILAANRARNFVGWSILCAVFPIFLLVIYFHKPLREVEGKFWRCRSCSEFLKWREDSCRYCGTPRATPR